MIANQQALMTAGTLACSRVTLELSASNLAEALKLKQAMQSTGMNSLNSCWSSDSSWQLLVMEESGALPYTYYWHYSCTVCLLHGGLCEIEKSCMNPLSPVNSCSSCDSCWQLLATQETIALQ